MILPGHGLGRDTDVVGGYSAFGLGRLVLAAGPIVTGSVEFAADFDFSAIEQRDANVTILFNAELDEAIATQLDYRPVIQFTADMGADLVGQLDTDVFIQFNTDLDFTIQEFLIEFILAPLHLYEIPEEIREIKVSQEVRSIEILPYDRGIKIYFEDRTVVILPKLEE